MSDELCAVCGLPTDLCVCEEIAKEEQIIRVFIEKRRYGKNYTLVTGIDPNEVDLSALAKKLKSRLACGGTAKEGRIELQGDHRYKIKAILEESGFPPSNIEVQF
ncbi:MAG: stress response translation initiation inhibitor YciH [Candidatus Heimdallarchaeota archaeon]|nr:stress response translation initiation inhibitor YciH [Candidatus Heimdallarchaeota archaeon]MCK4771086.1 stress response translation initiation inhibitor YciH [Candidatus Heimdallarchaeota archaeon]